MALEDRGWPVLLGQVQVTKAGRAGFRKNQQDVGPRGQKSDPPRPEERGCSKELRSR